MDTVFSSHRMRELAWRGCLVRWRDPRHAQCLGWDEWYGPGPFEVVRVVDHTAEDLPPGLVLKTRLGEREVNSVWFVPAGEQAGLAGRDAGDAGGSRLTADA